MFHIFFQPCGGKEYVEPHFREKELKQRERGKSSLILHAQVK